jgi:signal transduction histidine kinase
MTFSRKIFIAVFFSVLVLGSGLLWVAHRQVDAQYETSFRGRYDVFAKVLGDTLSRLDSNTEALMLNAVKVIVEKDAQKGILSTEELRALRSELSVTHAFVLDRKGNFVRSTNEDPKLIPNVFSFCPAYRELYARESGVEATPVIHPMPEPKPYKFLYVPSKDKQRLLEVAVRVDFVAKTLTEALDSDPNVTSLSLFAPNGQAMGRFKAKDVEFPEASLSLPAQFPAIVEADDSVNFYTKVASSHPKCCQCDVSGTSKNGEYYYILETKVSKRELATVKASSKTIFLLLIGLNLILALIFGRFLSRRLVKNIELAVSRVRDLKTSPDLKNRIKISGKDEVSYLTCEFDKLLDSLQESQQKLVEAEKSQAKVQLAREVAHNIKSPILAVEMILPLMPAIPEKFRKVLKDSVSEIKGLAERLTRDSNAATSLRLVKSADFTCLKGLLSDLIDEKRIELSGTSGISISHLASEVNFGKMPREMARDLKCVLSNLINNAAESYLLGSGPIDIEITEDQNSIWIAVQDKGIGMPKAVLDRLGTEQITVGKPNGSGVGLYHARKTITSLGGELKIQSEIGNGTRATLSIPKRQLG